MGEIFQDTLKDGAKGPEMVVIPAGIFRMGDIQGIGKDWEKPVHTVHINKPFALGQYPVTFEEYDKFAAATGEEKLNDEGWERGRRPVIYVNWFNAKKYAAWLSKETGKRYRLPTEAEWEYACRASSETAYCFGDDEELLSQYAWHEKNSARKTHPVGEKLPNDWKLYDMHGNVWEWVEDCWHDSYGGAPDDGTAWEKEDCGQRVLRGGSWFSRPERLRSAARGRGITFYRGYNYVGFRLAQDL